MAIGKLQAALAAATNEITLTAANLNFDFTLVKYEAPKEYQPLGEVLSKKRKQDAESGTSHITARRLGALFEDVCPATPNLVKAYGTRVSEISRMIDDKKQSRYSDSIFSAYSGVDGTSIWAAATSSKAALHVHLLNCMLARFWDASEAISIWVELVNERKREVAERVEKGEPIRFALAAAAGQAEVSRSQLAEWDSSARAWIRSADKVKSKEQLQLKLILENLNVLVDEDKSVHSGVIRVWISALETMEKLVSGQPQAIQDGAPILALSAWHLYPDLVIFGKHNAEVRMNDSLIKQGGVLSLGLLPDHRLGRSGVYWCLSLAHLRHYGRPVPKERQLHTQLERISFPQFLIAAIGTILGYWRIPSSENRHCITALLMIGETMHGKQQFYEGSWVHALIRGASEFLSATGEEQKMAEKLVELGKRRWRSFIATENSETPDSEFSSPLFGLLNENLFLQCLHGPEERIKLLRRLAYKRPALRHHSTILRYYGRVVPADSKERPEDVFADSSPSKTETELGNENSADNHDKLRFSGSIPPTEASSQVLDSSLKSNNSPSHGRQDRDELPEQDEPDLSNVAIRTRSHEALETNQNGENSGEDKKRGDTEDEAQKKSIGDDELHEEQAEEVHEGQPGEIFEKCSDEQSEDHGPVYDDNVSEYKDSSDLDEDDEYEDDDDDDNYADEYRSSEGESGNCMKWMPQFATLFPGSVPFNMGDSHDGYEFQGHIHHRFFNEAPFTQPPQDERHHYNANLKFENDRCQVAMIGEDRVLDILFGDADGVGVFLHRTPLSAPVFGDPPQISFEDIIWCLQSDMVSMETLWSLLNRSSSIIRSLLSALAFASRVYTPIPDADVAIRVLSEPLLDAKWVRALLIPDRSERPWYFRHTSDQHRILALSLVAYLDSGYCNVDPEVFTSAFAISSGDSLYVNMILVCDPYEQPRPWELRKILGNIGKPGVNILQCPKDPMVRDITSGLWRPADSSTFDGSEESEDYFNRTSLHLSFTTFERPVYREDESGQHDTQVSVLESVVSVHDSGNWVADIDILKAQDRNGDAESIYRLKQADTCDHEKQVGCKQSFVCLKSWDEVIDFPDGPFVIPAHGNWVARLALASVLSQLQSSRDIKVTVCPPSVCWQCLEEEDSPHAYIL